MRDIIKGISKKVTIDNITDARVTGINLDGTYDIQLSSGAIKKRALDISSGNYGVGDVVNISLVGGNKETAKILGKSRRFTRKRRTFYV